MAKKSPRAAKTDERVLKNREEEPKSGVSASRRALERPGAHPKCTKREPRGAPKQLIVIVEAENNRFEELHQSTRCVTHIEEKIRQCNRNICAVLVFVSGTFVFASKVK